MANCGLLGLPDLRVAALRWQGAGKLDYALGGRSRAICLGKVSHEFGLVSPASEHAGEDVLIAAPRHTLWSVVAAVGRSFGSIEAIPTATIRRAGRAAAVLPLFVGHRLRKAP